MKRIFAYLLAVVVLGALAYTVYLHAPRLSSPAGSAATTTGITGVQMQVATELDDTDVYHIEARYPQFGIPAVDSKIKAAVESAVSDFKSIPPLPPGSAAQKNQFIGSFAAVSVESGAVSVELLFSEDTGGAHPNTTAVTVNVNPQTGQDITLDSALAMTGLSLQQVAAESLTQLQTQLGADLIFPDGANPLPDNYSTFLIGTSTVTFVFQNYQVAPYSDGMQQVSFPIH
jgi:hypothetical protein